ncbi:MAG: hypothetical protein M3347_07260, partial [Armatimonadota bacterium]|nr:hypothetical protein [Armatimonadota bacterium]
MKRPLRIGIVGLQGYGGTYFGSLQGRADVQIAALCDANPAALQDTAKHGIERTFSDYEELLAAGITDA